MTLIAKPTVTLATGKANFSGVLATYACMKVEPPFQRVTAINSGERVGKQDFKLTGTHEVNGTIVTTNVRHELGTVVLLQSKWMTGPRLIREGSLFMRLRQGAPGYQINAKVPTSHENIIGDRFAMFYGNADILTVEELAMLGIDVNRGYASRYMDLDELAGCYEIVQVSAESTPRPSVEVIATPTGEEFREVAQAPKRRIILRR